MRFRANAFGWKSQPSITRVREAVAEIKKVAKKEPVLGAEGAVLFLERVSGALAHVDSSSGSMGSAVNRAIAGDPSGALKDERDESLRTPLVRREVVAVTLLQVGVQLGHVPEVEEREQERGNEKGIGVVRHAGVPGDP